MCPTCDQSKCRCVSGECACGQFTIRYDPFRHMPRRCGVCQAQHDDQLAGMKWRMAHAKKLAQEVCLQIQFFLNGVTDGRVSN